MGEFLVLPVEFSGRGEVSGINFKQVKRNNNFAIYERSDGHYEVVKIIKREAVEIFGKQYPPMEIYPKGESWVGKCVSSLDRAKMHFDKMSKLES